MGTLLTRLPRLTLAQLRTLRSTTAGTCHRDLENFPSPRWDFHMFGACLCLQGGGVMVWGGGVSFSSCTITGNTASGVRAHAQTSHRPNGENADALADALDSRLHNCKRRFGQPQSVRAVETSKVPIAPMGFSHVLRVCLQGGGVYTSTGTVSFSSCTITGNSASSVRAHVRKFPSPRWENR